jgi:hypothetical protein
MKSRKRKLETKISFNVQLRLRLNVRVCNDGQTGNKGCEEWWEDDQRRNNLNYIESNISRLIDWKNVQTVVHHLAGNNKLIF